MIRLYWVTFQPDGKTRIMYNPRNIQHINKTIMVQAKDVGEALTLAKKWLNTEEYEEL